MGESYQASSLADFSGSWRTGGPGRPEKQTGKGDHLQDRDSRVPGGGPTGVTIAPQVRFTL